MDHDSAEIKCGVAISYEAVIELRDGYAELAIRKFRIDVVSANQQIGTVQGHAEGCIQKSRRNHAGPCRKIPVVNVDMPHAFFSEAYRNVSSQVSMCESSYAPRNRFCASDSAPQKIRNCGKL
jgi:hypothetical protein